MPTFTVSISEEEYAPLKREADKSERSVAAQVRYILGKWFEEQQALEEREKT